MGQSRPLFGFFVISTIHNSINWWKRRRCAGTRTRGGRMEGADESTELWPVSVLFLMFFGRINYVNRSSILAPKQDFSIFWASTRSKKRIQLICGPPPATASRPLPTRLWWTYIQRDGIYRESIIEHFYPNQNKHQNHWHLYSVKMLCAFKKSKFIE